MYSLNNPIIIDDHFSDDIIPISSIIPHPTKQQPIFPPPIETDSPDSDYSENDYSVPNRDPNFSSISIFPQDRAHLAHQVISLNSIQNKNEFFVASKI